MGQGAAAEVQLEAFGFNGCWVAQWQRTCCEYPDSNIHSDCVGGRLAKGKRLQAKAYLKAGLRLADWAGEQLELVLSVLIEWPQHIAALAVILDHLQLREDASATRHYASDADQLVQVDVPADICEGWSHCASSAFQISLVKRCHCHYLGSHRNPTRLLPEPQRSMARTVCLRHTLTYIKNKGRVESAG